MIRILIEDGDDVVVEAVIDVTKRRVVSLRLDDERPMESAYVAMAVLSGEIEAQDVLGRKRGGAS